MWSSSRASVSPLSAASMRLAVLASALRDYSAGIRRYSSDADAPRWSSAEQSRSPFAEREAQRGAARRARLVWGTGARSRSRARVHCVLLVYACSGRQPGERADGGGDGQVGGGGAAPGGQRREARGRHAAEDEPGRHQSARLPQVERLLSGYERRERASPPPPQTRLRLAAVTTCRVSSLLSPHSHPPVCALTAHRLSFAHSFSYSLPHRFLDDCAVVVLFSLPLPHPHLHLHSSSFLCALLTRASLVDHAVEYRICAPTANSAFSEQLSASSTWRRLNSPVPQCSYGCTSYSVTQRPHILLPPRASSELWASGCRNYTRTNPHAAVRNEHLTFIPFKLSSTSVPLWPFLHAPHSFFIHTLSWPRLRYCSRIASSFRNNHRLITSTLV